MISNFDVLGVQSLFDVQRKGNMLFLTDFGENKIHVVKEDGTYVNSMNVSPKPARLAIKDDDIWYTSSTGLHRTI